MKLIIWIFINGIDAASLENEFKNWKINFKDKDNDFKLGYKMGKRQYRLQRKDKIRQKCFKNTIIGF